MDSGFRRNEGFWTFDEFIKLRFRRGDVNKLILQLAYYSVKLFLTFIKKEYHSKKIGYHPFSQKQEDAHVR